MELSPFQYDIIYRPGKDNKGADTLSRIDCLAVSSNSNTLKHLHDSFCHPGVTRMYHFVQNKNLPFPVNEGRQLTSDCSTCAKIKPRFYKSKGTLIKATQPFESLILKVHSL